MSTKDNCLRAHLRAFRVFAVQYKGECIYKVTRKVDHLYDLDKGDGICLNSTIVEKLGRPGTDVTEDMIHLRLKITDMIWHIDQIDELLMRVIHPEDPADDDHQETEFA